MSLRDLGRLALVVLAASTCACADTIDLGSVVDDDSSAGASDASAESDAMRSDARVHPPTPPDWHCPPSRDTPGDPRFWQTPGHRFEGPDHCADRQFDPPMHQRF